MPSYGVPHMMQREGAPFCCKTYRGFIGDPQALFIRLPESNMLVAQDKGALNSPQISFILDMGTKGPLIFPHTPLGFSVATERANRRGSTDPYDRGQWSWHDEGRRCSAFVVQGFAIMTHNNDLWV